MTAITELAPAKINLALHVTGQRSDGYHLLETLVTFADAGDLLTFTAADSDRLTVSGRFGPLLSADPGQPQDNLVLTALSRLRDAVTGLGHSPRPVHIHLEKNLPVAAGIGGGSADAAATIRGLLRFWGVALPAGTLDALCLGLGADVPMCLARRPLVARGIGEALTLLPSLPRLALVLANPLMPVSTPAVFRRLTNKQNPPLVLADDLTTEASWLDAIARLRNDLEPPARQLLAEIAGISQDLHDSGADLVRMSGSGATCFGIYPDIEAARRAERQLHSRRPDWYFQATETRGGGE